MPTAIAGAALLAAATGCGGDGDGSTANAPPPASVSAARAAPEPPPAPPPPAGRTVRFRSSLRPHDVLLIADRAEILDAQNIRQDAEGRGVTTLVADVRGHGVELLPSAKVVKAVVDWLDTRVKAGT